MPYFDFQGKRIHYREKGSEEVLVFLTGNTSSSAVHDGEIDYFAKKYRVICPNYIGYGKSRRIEPFPSDFWWVNAHIVVELVRNLAIDSVVIVGTSGGGAKLPNSEKKLRSFLMAWEFKMARAYPMYKQYT